jgi:hypothetical protein
MSINNHLHSTPKWHSSPNSGYEKSQEEKSHPKMTAIQNQILKESKTPAEWLVHYRLNHVPFLSQNALGRATGINGSYIGKCELGNRPISRRLSSRLATFFNVDRDFFMRDITSDAPTIEAHRQCVSNTRSAFTRVESKTTPLVPKDTSPFPKEDSLSQSEIGRGIKRGREGELSSNAIVPSQD